MAMSQSVLSTQLSSALGPASTEAQGIANFAAAYGTYAASATSATPILPAAVTAGKAAMSAAMVGVSAVGAPKIIAGCQAFWVAVAALLAGGFAGAVAVVPPPMTGLVAALPVVLAQNMAQNATQQQACDAIAAVLHAQAIVGGTVTYVGPVVAPIF